MSKALDKSGIKSLSLDIFGNSNITALFSFSKNLSSKSLFFSKKMIFILFEINSLNNFLLSLYLLFYQGNCQTIQILVLMFELDLINYYLYQKLYSLNSN